MVAEYLDKNYDRVCCIGASCRVLTSSVPFKFFSSYTTLILSENYVTKRQSLKLLGEILLDRANFNVMTRYIANEANLKMMMNLLRDRSKNIQFEAFHVFKVLLQPCLTSRSNFPPYQVFVANPKKPPQIETILRRNKDKLLVFLKGFHNDKEGELFSRIDWLGCPFTHQSFIDEQFSDEKQFLIVQIQGLWFHPGLGYHIISGSSVGLYHLTTFLAYILEIQVSIGSLLTPESYFATLPTHLSHPSIISSHCCAYSSQSLPLFYVSFICLISFMYCTASQLSCCT